ncbi:outer membrane protein TOM13-domain-containing protein [Apodospora peruviana]|uniref:Outer membrane protein TOM13-domain-containing protein n=1 Tax=Apodospora peruviana TaxID=516989 RepID=A0AAE0IIY7_9PEZI|nr:outer membrane protein TOM13-domain-containing protein [Apodospora peruviana]
MSSEEPQNPMAESGVTMRSDSEQYSGPEDISTSPPSSSSPPAVILYQPPTIWSILRSATINLFLPFINGMMLGFGELFAHEAAFRLGWSGTRSLRRSSTIPSISRPARQFGTALRTSLAAPIGASYNAPLRTPRIGGAIALAASARQARYASTQPPTDPAAAVPGTSLPSSTEFSASPIELTGSDLLNMPEHIGFLKAYGLDYGWGPTAMMEWTLEHIYVYTGMPWWASITLVAFAFKASIFKISLDAMAQSQKMQDLRKNPRFLELEEKQKTAIAAGSMHDALGPRGEIAMMYRAAGIKTWKLMIPMINIPITYGMFRLCRGMAALPVPSLENGGALWFPDLSAADPLFILPVVTAALVWKGFQVSLPYMAASQQNVMRILGVVMVPLSLIFTVKISAAAQLFFLVTAFFHTMQTHLFYSNWFRLFMGFGPLPPKGGAKPAAAPHYTWQAPKTIDAKANVEPVEDSYFSALKDSVMTAKDKVKATVEKRGKSMTEKDSVKEAKAYEERRALEEKEKLIARREIKQMKRRQR